MVLVDMSMPIRCPCELAEDNNGWYAPCFAYHGIPEREKEFDACVEHGTLPEWCPVKRELVRCGECRWWEREIECKSTSYGSCKIPLSHINPHCMVPEDYYCADGDLLNGDA